MARMCANVTVACALVLAAGTAASAVDKVSTDLSTSVQGTTLLDRVPGLQVNQNLFVRVGTCEDGDAWDNGGWDGRNGQTSHEGGAVKDGAKAADDFYLNPCYVWNLDSIQGCLITDSKYQLAGARLELYADCNGCPGELLYTFTEFEKERGASIGEGFYLITYTFNVDDQLDEDLNDIVLKGGHYWVSIVGESDGLGSDSSFMATAGEGVIRQAVAKKIDGANDDDLDTFDYSGSSWESLDECPCIGCSDLCFEVVADPCLIYWDNGGADEALNGIRSQTSNNNAHNSRAADNIGTNPCEDITVCYFEACVHTNCEDFDVVLEVYNNDCAEPDFALGDEPFRGPYPATKIILEENDALTEGSGQLTRRLDRFRVEWHKLSIDLPRNANYWFSVSTVDQFSFNERAYWCYNATCPTDDCEIQISPAQQLFPGASSSTSDDVWVEFSDDLSFLVAIEPSEEAGNESIPTCAADFNIDGRVSSQDVYDFLSAWFVGCP